MSYLGLARKYRPQKFSDLIGQEIVVKILENSIKSNKIAHAYVFSGPKGVGKTSTARILAKALNCKDLFNKPCDKCSSCIAIKEARAMNVIEIDAASHTSVENIRDLRENVKYASAEGGYKVYIIDEAHMLSQAAFNAFLKTLEEPPMHVVFVLATTEPRKIPITVMSRCQHLQFKRIPINFIRERLRFICEQEGIAAEEEALYLIASNAEGSMRDALTLLDQISSFSEKITTDSVNLLLGHTDIEILAKLTEFVIKGEKERIIEEIESLNDKGTDFKILVRDLIYFLRNLLMKKFLPTYRPDISEFTEKIVTKLSELTSEEHLIVLLKDLINAELSIKNSLFPRIIFELTLLKLSLMSHFQSIDKTIEELKGRGHNDMEKNVTPYNKKDFSTLESDSKDIAKIWENYLEQLEINNHLLALKLKQAKVQFNENEIKLIFNGGASVHAESIKESLPEIIRELREFYPEVKIKIDEKEHEKKDIRSEAINNPLVKKALQLFDGRIYNIKLKKGGSIDV